MASIQHSRRRAFPQTKITKSEDIRTLDQVRKKMVTIHVLDKQQRIEPAESKRYFDQLLHIGRTIQAQAVEEALRAETEAMQLETEILRGEASGAGTIVFYDAEPEEPPMIPEGPVH